jgi:ribonuclease G
MIRLKKEILINSQSEDEIRIAITENDQLVELFIETPETERHVGDIYLGKLAKVIPGMNAAFVNVGLEQDAFLHFSDVGDSYESSAAYLSGEDAELSDDDDEEEDYLVEEGATAAEQKVIRPRNQPRPDRNDPNRRGGDRGGDRRGGDNRGGDNRNGGPPDRSYQDIAPKPLEIRLASQRDPNAPLSDRGAGNRQAGRPIPTLLQANVNLEPGQNILVQVTREAFANKGVRVTSRISLPGRFLVLVPFEPGIGISRKVYSVRERSRLRRIVRSLKPRELGVIIRTVAENKEESALREDLEKLLEQWRELEKKIKEGTAPMLVYQDQSLTSSVMRDLFTPDISRIVIDSKKMYREVMDYVEWAAPNLTGTVESYRGQRPLFDGFNIERQIEQTLTRKIQMPSGGYLFIEHTEAMVVIDVNSGRYAARREQELNSLKTNLESAREIARQLRLRDIGGIIVVDFIDMNEERNRKKVYDEMKKEFRKDRAKSSILPLTEFGLMQITRQRIRQSIVQSLSEPCPVCAGTGQLVSKTTLMKQIERWLDRFKAEGNTRRLVLRVHPTLADILQKGFMSPIRTMQLHYFVRLKIETDDSLAGDDFRFFSPKQDKDITQQFSSTGILPPAVSDEEVGDVEEMDADVPPSDSYEYEEDEENEENGEHGPMELVIAPNRQRESRQDRNGPRRPKNNNRRR